MAKSMSLAAVGAKVDLSKCNPSAFTLTFVIEVVGIDVFHDCDEGWVNLGSGPVDGLRLQYQLVPGQNLAIDVVIWPHVAKAYYGLQSTWIRTWFFLQRRWLAFTISHLLPVRVEDYALHVATITPAFGLTQVGPSARSDKVLDVYCPKLAFGERRQFAPVIDEEISLFEYFRNTIWSLIEKFIPATYTDQKFDVPYPVTDKRHQDAVIEEVQHVILNPVARRISSLQAISKVDAKGKPKKTVEVTRAKYELNLTGDEIISGTGRIIRFRETGEKVPETGEIIVLIATNGLPAPDDKPIIFVNIGQITDVPLREFEKYNITDIYTKWSLHDREHQSELRPLKDQENIINIDDHHAEALPSETASETISRLLGDCYEIELRGIRTVNTNMSPKFFGYAKGDRDYPSTAVPKLENSDTDVLIGVIKIDVRQLTHKTNAFIRGEYPVYPLEVSVQELSRDRICTNDLNGVRAPLIPDIIVPTAVILHAQMTVEVSIGLVGCKPHRHSNRYSRLYDVVRDTQAIMTVLNYIIEINDQVMETGVRDDLLSGFALDTGDAALLYVEGLRDRQILHVWEITADFFPEMKPIFSSSAKYNSRLYPEFPMGAVPFIILKMFVPLSVLLACPPIYARPALPLLTRHAVLKFGRLLSSKRMFMPNSKEMPTTAELRSFRLELCVAPRPPPISTTLTGSNEKAGGAEDPNARISQIAQKINWEVSEPKEKK